MNRQYDNQYGTRIMSTQDKSRSQARVSMRQRDTADHAGYGLTDGWKGRMNAAIDIQ
jgi:hypothetical protein